MARTAAQVNEVNELVKGFTPDGKVMLGFSCGKDSWAAWIAIRDEFEVIPYYLYLVPGLSWIEDYLAYAERKIGRRIIRLPHPGVYRMLNNFTFQPPERCAIIEAAKFPDVTYDDINLAVCQQEGLDERTWTASGVRAADSPMRRAALLKSRGIVTSRRYFYPVWDWNKERLIAELKRADIRLPLDYRLFGRSFDGIDLRFLIKIRESLPADYDKILEMFPLADMEIARYEFWKRQQAA